MLLGQKAAFDPHARAAPFDLMVVRSRRFCACWWRAGSGPQKGGRKESKAMTKTVFKKMVLLGRATTFLAGLAVNLRGETV